MKKIALLEGYAIVPDESTVIDLSGGNAADVGVIADRRGELPYLVVVSDKSVQGLSAEDESRIVDEAIKDLPSYVEVKSQELPYPTRNASKEEWRKWNDSFRLGFFPLALFQHLTNRDYRLYEE